MLPLTKQLCPDCKTSLARCICKPAVKKPKPVERETSKANVHANDAGDPNVKKLVELGFAEAAAIEALRLTHGNVNQAASHLASPGGHKKDEDARSKSPLTREVSQASSTNSASISATDMNHVREKANAALALAQSTAHSIAQSISQSSSPTSSPQVSQTLHNPHRQPAPKDFGTWHGKANHPSDNSAPPLPTSSRLNSEYRPDNSMHVPMSSVSSSSSSRLPINPASSLNARPEGGDTALPVLNIPPSAAGPVSLSPMNVEGIATGASLKRGGGGGGGGGGGATTTGGTATASKDTGGASTATAPSAPTAAGAGAGAEREPVDYNQMETNSSEGLDLPPPRKPAAPKTPLSLEVGSFLDVRDSVGKWLEGEIIKREEKRIKIHFLRWGSKWDEWIQVEDEGPRLSEFHRYSSASSTVMSYSMKDMCTVYAPKPAPPAWQVAEICKIDGTQVQVQYDRGNKKYQYWFSIDTDEIRPLGQTPAAPSEPGPNDKWWVGQFVEVKDTIDKWIAAEIEEVKKDDKGEVATIRIHYNGWSKKWDEWLDVTKDKDRIRALGSDIEETVEEKKKKEEEEKFRKSLRESTGYEVVDQERDGNCLFRSVAHQIFNDAEKYKEVRQKCYDYMERDKLFFSLYVADDFDEYVKRQRQDKQWGDHVEIVALREMYNKNLEIYDKDSVKAPKPLGLSGDHKIPIMRLSYHGANHYNSLIDPKAPPPLGDGADCPVNMRSIRLDEEKKSTPIPRRMSRQHSRVGSIAASSTLFRKVEAGSQDTSGYPGEEFMKTWRMYEDKEHAGFMPISGIPLFLKDAIRFVFAKKYQRYKGDKVQQEAIHKSYSEVKDEIPEMVNKTTSKLDLSKNQNVALADFKAHFYGEIIGEIFWEANK